MDAKQINALVNGIVNQMAKKTPQTDVSTLVSAIPNTEKPVPQAAKKDLFGGIGNILKTVAPVAASFIPGVGPIASQLLSTLNDDSWFEEYTSAGASFNEKLVTKLVIDGTAVNPRVTLIPRAAFAQFITLPSFEGGVRETVGSSMIAYIRKQTNNVLSDDTDSYYSAIDAAMQLYALHYSLQKWIKFSQKQPLNIPLVTDVIQALTPSNLNKLIGIADALKQYLQSTIKLPYPLVEAMRWRFGTLFHSFNTGQPGYITYDPLQFVGTKNDLGAFMNDLSNMIRLHQGVIIASGRASADVTLAYTNHINRLDVEDSHYDEKEFNLRHNLTVDGIEDYVLTDLIPIIKDSRLATSPAIQASLLSLSTQNAGKDTTLFRVVFVHEPGECTHTSSIHYYQVASGSQITSINAALNVITEQLTKESGWFEFDMESLSIPDDTMYKIDNTSGPGALTLQDPTNEGNRARVSRMVYRRLGTALQRSLGLYKSVDRSYYRIYQDGVSNDYADITMSNDQISYDLALVSLDTVRAIQTASLRNLFRGNMPGPKPEVTTADLKPAIEKIATAVDKITP